MGRVGEVGRGTTPRMTGSIGWWLGGGIAVVAVVLLVLEQSAVAIAAISIVIGLLLAKAPRVGLTLWLLALVAVPAWLTVTVGTALSPTALATIVLLPAILTGVRYTKFNSGDVVMLSAVALIAVAVILFSSPERYAVGLIVGSMSAYLVGRFLSARTGVEFVNRLMCVAVVAVAAWSVFEFLTGFHPFTGVSSPTGWNLVQTRGQFDRSEAAFGHSIALGGFLAAGIPFVVLSRLRPGWKFAAVSLALLGAACTLSRSGIIAAVGAMFAALLLERRDGTHIGGKVLAAFLAVGILALVAPILLDVFASAEGEVSDSTLARDRVLSAFITDIGILGPADGYIPDQTGQYVYQSFVSIDNSYVLLALQYGASLVLLLAIPVMLATVVRIFRRRAFAADFGLLALVVLLSSVAMILQLGPLVFFLAGLAVTANNQLTQSPPGVAIMSRGAAPSAASSKGLVRL